MKAFTSTFETISHSESDRADFGFHYVDQILDYNPLRIKDAWISLSDVLVQLNSKKLKKGSLDRPYKLVSLDNIEKRISILTDVEYTTEINSDKTLLHDGDIVIAKLTPQLGNMFLNTNHEELLGSSELIEYSIRDYDKTSLFYILTSEPFLKALGYLESGKIQRRVNPVDLLKLKIPKNTYSLDDEIKEKSKQILSLHKNIKNLNQIVDESFEAYFHISTRKATKKIKTNLRNIANDETIRCSFHNQQYYYSFDYGKLNGEEWTDINNIFAIKGGKRIPKGSGFANADTGFYYLRPMDVDIFGIKKDSLKQIDEDIYNKLKFYKINSGELCLSIVGTLGKIALVDLDQLEIGEDKLILSENFAKLVPKETINSKFYYYYFWSYIFREQIDREFTITDQKKLGLNKIYKLKVPCLDSENENKILTSIEKQMEEQKEIRDSIKETRDEIDFVIKRTIF